MAQRTQNDRIRERFKLPAWMRLCGVCGHPQVKAWQQNYWYCQSCSAGHSSLRHEIRTDWDLM